MDRYTKTTFESLDHGEQFKTIPSSDSDKYMKVEESVSVERGGLYNTIVIEGTGKYKKLDPTDNVYRIKGTSQIKEV